MLKHRHLIVFAFVILVFAAIYMASKAGPHPGVLALIVLVYFIATYVLREGYTNPNSILLPTGGGLNDNSKLSRYGNLPISEIDMSTQEMPSGFGSATGVIDNSDVIEQAITRGVSLFNPDGSGFSPLQADSATVGPGMNNPLSGKQNIDEMMARKAQHTSSLNKRALDGAVRSTKNKYWINFQEELDENEKREWWTSEAQDMETDWTPY